MTDTHVPRENEPGEYYGHPAIYIGPRGTPSGRSWAVYVADGGAHDRHTVVALVETEAKAAEIASHLINKPHLSAGASAKEEPFHTFSVPFHQLSTTFPLGKTD